MSGTDEEGPATEGSSFRNLTQALISPGEAFAALAKRPRFLLALLLLVLVATLSVYLSMQKVDAGEMLRVLEERGKEFPPKLHDDPERLKAFSLWSATIWTPIAFSGFLFLEAALFMVIYRMLGSELTFRQSAATAVHAGLPLVVASVVGIAVALGREQIGFLDIESGGLVPSNLGFLASEETSRAMRALLTSVDLFSAWCIVLLATGYRIVARVTEGTAWAVTLTLWTVGILAKLALTAAF
jgi:hypothetical protein